MKCIKTLLLVFLLVFHFEANSQLPMLSDQAEVSIITCGPWQTELYAAFGHSAVRVYDPALGLNEAYNYGVFDFNQPNFYLNFARGFLYYKLGVYSYPDFRDFYIYYNRSVTEQVLDLTQEQKQAVYQYLEWNAKPENETYRYDYFYNNCATKVRDVFADVLKDSVHFDGSFITTQYTIRELTGQYLQYQPWGDLGIDICLGLPMDKRAAPYEYMYLPDYIESSFDHVTITRNGNRIPIVKSKQQVFVSRPMEISLSWFHPWVVFGTFLLVTASLSFYDWRRRKLSKWFDVVLFGTTGLLGILLLLLWTATDHKAAANNFNLLWALPTHILVLGIVRKKLAAFYSKYFMVVAALCVLMLTGWALLPQQLNVFLVPVVAAIGIRAFVASRLINLATVPV